MARVSRVHIEFPASVERVFAYLADPELRPRWQSSLRRVEMHTDGPPRVGTSWLDVTSAGIRPEMEIVELVENERWVERGRWRGITAELALTFAPSGAGTTVTAETTLDGRRLWRVAAAVATVLSGPAIRSDLSRAARSFDGAGA